VQAIKSISPNPPDLGAPALDGTERGQGSARAARHQVGLRASAKPIAAFFLKAALWYALLLFPWLGGARVYATAFRTAGNVLFRVFGSSGRVYFNPLPPGKERDTEIVLENIKTRGARGTMDANSRRMGFMATAFLSALVLATPIPRPRRLVALVWGLVLISVFVAFKMYLQLVNAFSDDNVLAIYTFGAFTKTVVVALIKVFSMSPVTAYIAPVVIWVLVAFRRGDLAGLAVFRRTSGEATSSKAAARS